MEFTNFASLIGHTFKMKLILFIFLVIGVNSFAQQHPTDNTQCQMIVDDILREQSFDIDDPISEDARYIFFELYEELNQIYIAEENNNLAALPTLISDFEETIQRAIDMELNYSMFQGDITHVESISI